MAWGEEAIGQLARRVDELCGDFKDFREEVRERFDTIDEAHERVDERASKIDWKTVLAFFATVVVPIVVALIVQGGGG